MVLHWNHLPYLQVGICNLQVQFIAKEKPIVITCGRDLLTLQNNIFV